MDKVNRNVELLEEETMQLVKDGYITLQQYSSIMKKRRDFEIKMAGTSTNKKSIAMKYIKFELQLDVDLHNHHQTKQRQDGNFDRSFEFKIRSPLRHALSIFHKACDRYSNDENLWLTYLNLRITRASHHGTGVVISKALQKLPKSAALWRTAAAFEFEINHRVDSARSLIQLGIQYNPTDQSLWHYFFQMELSYITQLINSIGIDNAKLKLEIDNENQKIKDKIDIEKRLKGIHDDQDEEEKEEKEDKVELDDQLKQGGENRFITFGREMFDVKVLKKSSIIQGKIACLIYQSAIKKIPYDFKFRQKFHTIARQFGEYGKQQYGNEMSQQLELNITLEILESLKRDFSSNQVDMWIMMASIELGDVDKNTTLDKNRVQRMLNLLNDGYKQLPKEEYVDQVVDSIINSVIKRLDINDDMDWEMIQLAENHINQLYQVALKDNILKESGYSKLISYYISTDRIDQAIQHSLQSTINHPESVILWLSYLSLYIKQKKDEQDDDNLTKLFEKSINSIFPISRTLTLNDQLLSSFKRYIILYLNHMFKLYNNNIKKLIDLLKKTIRITNGIKTVQDNIKLFMIDYLFLENSSINDWNEAYNMCLQFRPLPKEFYQRSIFYIQSRPSFDPNQVRSIYELYLQNKEFNSIDTETWLNYFNFELKINKDINRANIIGSRAKKTLSNPIHFIDQTQK